MFLTVLSHSRDNSEMPVQQPAVTDSSTNCPDLLHRHLSMGAGLWWWAWLWSTMAAAFQLLFVLVAAVIVSRGARAAQCTPDPTNPCKATCNGTKFDISNLFDYP